VKLGGRPLAAAKIVEAPSDGGYSLEAKVPWSALPKSRTVRIGYRGAVFFHDADASSRPETVIGTSEKRDYAHLPPLSLAPELALGSGLLRERNIQAAPSQNLLANVVGDALDERVLVYGPYLVVLGPGYREGRQYYYRDLEGTLLGFEVKDVTGDGRDDFFIKKRVQGSKGWVEVAEVLSYHGGSETPEPVFAQELRLAIGDDAMIENELRITGRGRGTQISLRATKARGIDQGSFARESNTGAEPVLLPWGEVTGQTFEFRDGRFVVRGETKGRGASAPAPAAAPRARPEPRPRGASWAKAAAQADPDGVYAHYKKQRDVRGKAKFDLRANLAEGAGKERVVVHDRDLVVFGEEFLGGRGFAAVELVAFARGADIKKLSTRDITRDGKQELVIEGVIESPMPDDLGGGVMKREVVMVYKVVGQQLERVFAAEVARNVGDKRVEATLRFTEGRIIELSPGRASGYSERTYPWRQKTTPDGGFEPLVLPWSGIDKVRLRFDGQKFARID
ncbi:MAG: hypothetical protein KC731_39345, partial [Myxococcales bacterium]|nr:hypothetical protein [Myxococcales bacterium]